MALALPKPADIKAKLGPLPVWVWGVLVGVVILGVVYYRRAEAKTAAADTTANGVSVSGEDLTSDLAGAASDGTTGASATDGTDLTTSSTVGQTNASWESDALAWLSSHGFSPLVAQNALETYLEGTLSSTDSAAVGAVNAAIQNFGLPPEGVFATPTVTSTTPTTVTGGGPAAVTEPGSGTWYLLNGTTSYITLSKGVKTYHTKAQWQAAGSPVVLPISAANLNALIVAQRKAA